MTTATLETLCDILSCTLNDIIGMSHNVNKYL
ncbi:MAG: helix-turn-helix domain-containing protein [Lachnospira sp.]|nr:helix-turn-helix domain-containing protein [Lachnospira sp.]